jgi:hypothetical protein
LPAIPAFPPQKEKAENRHEIVPSQSVFAIWAKRTARAKTDAFVEPINHAIQKTAYDQAENENNYEFKKHFLEYTDRQRSNKKLYLCAAKAVQPLKRAASFVTRGIHHTPKRPKGAVAD